LITEDNFDITDRFYGMFFEDAMRLRNTELEGTLMIKKEKGTLDSVVVKEVI
jgi:hypothetical protein